MRMYEKRYWCKRFGGISQALLREAVNARGRMVVDVKAWLLEHFRKKIEQIEKA